MAENAYSNLKITDVARRILEYLSKFAEKPEIAVRKQSNTNKTLKIIWRPTVDTNVTSGKVYIRYVQGGITCTLTKAQAIQYLVWLDDGNIGRHYSCFNGGN